MESSAEIKKVTDPIYQKVSKVIPEIEWAFHAPLIHKINMLKRLGHSKDKIHSKNKIINRYMVHRKKVLKYFEKKNNFIEIDLFKGEGWKKLCSFLDKDIPNIDFPHMNKKKI